MKRIKRKHRILIVFGVIFLVIASFGFYILSLYCGFPDVAQMEEVEASFLSQSFIFEADQKPTKSCHASTICEFNGMLYSAWFGGTNESNPDTTIWLSKYDGSGWSVPVDMSEIKDIAHWNPVLFAFDEKIYLYYKIGKKPSSWTTYYRYSSDGENWSEEKLFAEGKLTGRGPTKNKPIVLSNGEILAPASIEYYRTRHAQCFVDKTTDMINWTKKKDVRGNIVTELIQPSIVELDDGHVMMYIRTNRGRIFYSESKNYGESWTKAKPTALLNNNSGIDVAKNSNGVLAMVHNPVSENWGKRSPLVVGLSYDNGKTWTKQNVLENQDGEFSYPSIISVGNTFYITYTYNREQIRFAKLEV